MPLRTATFVLLCLFVGALWETTVSSSIQDAEIAPSSSPGCWRFREPTPAVVSAGGMVVTAEKEATRVGIEILEMGGNAVDAAVAVCFALAVTFPEAGNIGGGGFLVLRTADHAVAALDFREKAPLTSSREMYLDGEGNPTAGSLYGSLAVGVPGTVMGMAAVHETFGSLPWKTLLAPAIRLADRGFTIDPTHYDDFAFLAQTLATFGPDGTDRFQATREAFLPDGAPPPAESVFRQPDLARTLRLISDRGADGFYRGETADRIVEEMVRSGGILTREDLLAYEAIWREPVAFDYRGYTVLTMPPPSSGGVTLAMIAQILSGFDLSALDWEGPERIHLLAEAMKRAYADRNTYLGDPDFADLPLERLLSTTYAEARREAILPEAATPSSVIGGGLTGAPQGDHTTHFSIVDREGNAVSVTTTINTRFGSLVTVRGAGFLLNNEMDDFTSKPGAPNTYGLVQGEANAIEPSKRMLSSMTPTIVLDPEGELFLLTGSPGGSKIISTVFQTISNAIDYRMDLSLVVRAPRMHHQHLPDQIVFEYGGLSYETFLRLLEIGHTLQPVDAIGEVQAIRVLPDGRLAGVSDPRGNGVAAGTGAD